MSETRSSTKQWTAVEIEACLTRVPPRPPTPTLADRAAWKRYRDRSGIIQETKRAVAAPNPPLSAAIYLRTSRDGNRTAFQEVSFGRRERLAKLVLATAAAKDNGYLNPLVDTWISICEESTWVHPAHDLLLAEFSGTGRGIDLMAAETGLLLAESLAILGDIIPEFVRTRTRVEIEKRIFSRYMSDAEREYGWRGGTNNWAAVCAGCIAGTALYLMEDRSRLADLLERALATLGRYLEKAFLDDGTSDEGVGYWNYGFGHYVMIADMLRKATGGSISILDSEKIQRIARFPLEVQLVPGLFPAFADCSRDVRIGPWLAGFLAEETGERGWGAYAKDTAAPGRSFRYRDAFPPEPKRVKALPLPRLTYLPESQIWVARAKDLAVAAKGGHNGENHNHNDLGTFVLVLDGHPLIAEIGAPVYTRDTFNEHRYRCPAISSWGHSVPLVDGIPQREGRDAAAEVLGQEEGDDASVFRLDLTAAYPPQAGLASLTREFRVDRTGNPYLVLTDRYEWKGEKKGWEETFITFSPVGVVENGVILKGEKRQLRIEVSVPVQIAVKSVGVETPDGATPLRVTFTAIAPAPDTVEIRFLPGK